MNISRTALSRRSFLGASLMSAVAAGSATLLTACGNDGSSDGDKLILKFGVNNPKVTFDTQKTSGSIGVSEAVGESLLKLNPDTKEVEPWLPQSFPTSPTMDLPTRLS